MGASPARNDGLLAAFVVVAVAAVVSSVFTDSAPSLGRDLLFLPIFLLIPPCAGFLQQSEKELRVKENGSSGGTLETQPRLPFPGVSGPTFFSAVGENTGSWRPMGA